MNLHDFKPVPLALDEPDRGPLWKCAGCGAKRQDPSPRLTDNCSASPLFEAS